MSSDQGNDPAVLIVWRLLREPDHTSADALKFLNEWRELSYADKADLAGAANYYGPLR